MNRRNEIRIVGVILLLNLALATLFSTAPLFEGPDEIEHYAYLRQVIEHGPLPYALDPGSQLHHPPLYYWLLTPLAGLIGDNAFSKADWARNPCSLYLMEVPGADNKNLYLHGPREQFPYLADKTALTLHLIRLLSVVMGTCTVWVSYLIFATLWPTAPYYRLMATALVAFWPQFMYV